MSFLANLRKNSNANSSKPNRLVLCYLFEFLPEKTRTGIFELKFSLGLAELQQGQLIEIESSYLPLKEHLINIPAFIQPDDIEILEHLLNCGFENKQYYLPLLFSQKKLIEKIFSTKRVFIRDIKNNWNELVFSGLSSVLLSWQLYQEKESQQPYYQLVWQTNEKLHFLSDKTDIVAKQRLVLPWLIDLQENKVFLGENKLSIDEQKEIVSLHKKNKMLIKQQNIEGFFDTYTELWEGYDLPLPMPLKTQAIQGKVNARLVLEKNKVEGEVQDFLKLEFLYQTANFCMPFKYLSNSNACYFLQEKYFEIQRDFSQEKQFIRLLEETLDKFEVIDDCWITNYAECWKKLLIDDKKVLENAGFSFLIKSSFTHHYVNAEQLTLSINEGDGQQLTINIQAKVINEKIDLLSLLTQLEQFNRELNVQSVILNDGRILLLPENKFSGIMSEFSDLLSLGQDALNIPLAQRNRLQKVIAMLPHDCEWSGQTEYLDDVTSFNQAPKVLQRIVNGVNATLRPYQWLGVYWLEHLREHQINGLLADDMGLGKTLQTLTFLSLQQQQKKLKAPALIVAPTSLLQNWAEEINKFTPHLRYKIIHGAKRKNFMRDLNQYNVLITSYALVVNDLDFWQTQQLDWIILDEAQQIKNSRTKASQSLRELNATHKLCLSGTPVENNLSELWSLLEFLNPGVLGNLKSFKNYFQNSIEKNADEKKLQLLKDRVSPFILRRTKQQVASDLPAKTEVIQTISLSDEQFDFYEQQKQNIQQNLQAELDNAKKGQQQILLLTALMRLRQACCDPALLGEYTIKSAKRKHCIRMIKEVTAEKRAVLVFSQFTSMLELLATDLEKANIDYLKLTGKTSNRHKLVDSFQAGEASVFLISLKAGGVGLNLTRADTVIHFDPWWNSAAENQASDRVHRIGQDKPVFVYKLIAKDTIEEKIAILQQQKNLLSDQINQQAQKMGENFSLKLEDLMKVWKQEIN